MFNPKITFAPSPPPLLTVTSVTKILICSLHFESNCFEGKKLKLSEAVSISVKGLVHHQGPAPDQTK